MKTASVHVMSSWSPTFSNALHADDGRIGDTNGRLC